MMWDDAFFGAWHPFGMIAAIFAGVLLIILVTRLLPRRDRRRDDGRALDLLRERFARGEIDRTEFEERRRVLGGR